MRILVLGAGGVGGYFGGRLIEAGADVTFLVRDKRAWQLAEHGLVIQSPAGDATLKAATLTAADRGPSLKGGAFDLILLTCKAYDLAAAIESVAPHMAAGNGLVMPLLNGMAHIEVLRERFGADRVIGGLCGIFGTLSPEGVVVQMAGLPPRIAFGRFKDQMERNVLEAPIQQIEAIFKPANFATARVEPIEQGLWDKWVVLAALAASTCLMRGNIGAIVSGDEGSAIMQELFAETVSVARAAGYGPSDQRVTAGRDILTDRTSDATASMLRDILKGGTTEGSHIIGDLLRRARGFGLPTPLLRIANAHLQTYETQRGKKQD